MLEAAARGLAYAAVVLLGEEAVLLGALGRAARAPSAHPGDLALGGFVAQYSSVVPEVGDPSSRDGRDRRDLSRRARARAARGWHGWSREVAG